MKIHEYSVSNRGLRPNLVGTPEQLRERIEQYELAGPDLPAVANESAGRGNGAFFGADDAA